MRLSAAAPDLGGSWGMVLDSVSAMQHVPREVRDAIGLLSITVSFERMKTRE